MPNTPFLAPGTQSYLGGLSSGGGGLDALLAQLGPKWWQYLIGPGSAVLMDLFESIFGGEEKRKREALERQIQEYLPMIKPRYPMGDYQIQPGLLHGMNETTITAILNHLKRMGNFGMPQGMQMDTGFLDAFLAQLPGLASGPPPLPVQTPSPYLPAPRSRRGGI